VGDIHGNFHDLLRILIEIPRCSSNRVVFLGDYVDRGDYSLDCVLLLFTLKCLNPNGIVMLRGNHEFACTNQQYGFRAEVESRFPGTNIWERCNSIFAMLPFAVCLGDAAVAVHGGIGPGTPSLKAIKKITLPVHSYEAGDAVSDIVWSDPGLDSPEFQTSFRGVGVYFSKSAAMSFLEASGARRLIRAHECVASGLAISGPTITVFSSSNYCQQRNTAAFLFIDRAGFISNTILDPVFDVADRGRARYGTPPGLPQLEPVGRSRSVDRVQLRALVVKPEDSKAARRETLRFLGQGSRSAPKLTDIPPTASTTGARPLPPRGFVSSRDVRPSFVLAD
jgi:hypothetical protein